MRKMHQLNGALIQQKTLWGNIPPKKLIESVMYLRVKILHVKIYIITDYILSYEN